MLKAGTRIAFVATGIAAAGLMLTSAQTTEPVIESESGPEADAGEVGNARPTPGAASAGDNRSAQADSPDGPVPARVDLENQRETLNQFAEYITWWAQTVTWWLSATAIFLTLFAVVVAIAGFVSFKRFREIEAETRKSAATAEQHETAAERIRKRIEVLQNKSEVAAQEIQTLTAKAAVENSEEAKQAVKNVRENPEASLIDKAIARAVSLHQHGKTNDAIEKWRALTHIAEGSDNDLAARAWFSVGYLIQDKDPEGAVSAYDQVLRLTPDSADAYTNRGIAKAALERYVDAIADHNEALHLRPDYANAYTNRGGAKAALERYSDAIADFNEALDLKPDSAGAYYNRGLSEAALGLKSKAMKDFETALKLARNANDADLIDHVERVLRDREDGVS